MNRDFIDKYAMVGRPRLAPDSELTVSAQPSSRSLKDLAKFDKESRFVHAQIKDGILRLDLSHVIGDKIIINKKDALKFARWILRTYDSKRTNK